MAHLLQIWLVIDLSWGGNMREIYSKAGLNGACINDSKARTKHRELCSPLFLRSEWILLCPHANQFGEDTGDSAHALSSLLEKTRMS